jgi:DNA processing protein
MSAELSRPAPAADSACGRCLRRSWLLAQLSGPLDYCARDRGRLLELLALADEDLLDAVAGRRRAELRARYESFTHSPPLPSDGQVTTICRHAAAYPNALSGAGAPHMLELASSASRFAELTARPLVAIIGSAAASDYGMEVARSLARGLSASDVSVVAVLGGGIAAATHTGALEVGASIAVLGGGLGVSCTARHRRIYQRVRQVGCAVSELPYRASGRRWGSLAAERIVVELAGLTVLVEAEHTPAQLTGARFAQTLGRPLAVVPGRLTSPLSDGPHALLLEGASLLRGPEDALELLHRHGLCEQPRSAAAGPQASEQARGLSPDLRTILERVGSGCDTPDKLTRAGIEPAQALLGLSELELTGLLRRGDGGRYLPSHSFSTDR